MKDDKRFEKPKPPGNETVIVMYNLLAYVFLLFFFVTERHNFQFKCLLLFCRRISLTTTSSCTICSRCEEDEIISLKNKPFPYTAKVRRSSQLLVEWTFKWMSLIHWDFHAPLSVCLMLFCFFIRLWCRTSPDDSLLVLPQINQVFFLCKSWNCFLVTTQGPERTACAQKHGKLDTIELNFIDNLFYFTLCALRTYV